MTSRRRVLGWFGLAVAGGTAGCGDDDDPGPGLYAPNTQIIHRAGDDRFDYPEDVAVRVSVENTTSDRQEAILRTTLEYAGADDETPAVVESWTDERDISIPRGTSRQFLIVFEGVFREGYDEDGLRARAEIVGETVQLFAPRPNRQA